VDQNLCQTLSKLAEKSIGNMITIADLHEWVTYDPRTGEFKWRKRPERSAGGRQIGSTAGSVKRGRYPRRILWIKGQRINAARAAYMIVNGEIPASALIDHVDGDTLNDRIDNLRLANSAQNSWNRLQKNGSEMKAGVSRGIRGRFKARIQAVGQFELWQRRKQPWMTES